MARGLAEQVDPLRSLVITPTDVVRLLEELGGGADRPLEEHDDAVALADESDAFALAAAQEGADVRLVDLSLRFGLTCLDVDLLCVALAPDLDVRFGRLFAYLQDDFTAQRASVALALEVAGCSSLDADARSRLRPGAPLIDVGLLSVGDAESPWLQRPLVVSERVVMHILRDNTLDPSVRRVLLRPLPDLIDGADALGEALVSGSPLVYLREPADGVGVAHAAAALYDVDVRALAVDVAAGLAHGDDRIVEALILESRLLAAGLIVPRVDELALIPGAVDRLCEAGGPVVLVGAGPWDPAWSAARPLCLDLPPLSLEAQRSVWANALEAVGAEGAEGQDRGFHGLAGFDLSPTQVVRTAQEAAQRARHAHRELIEADLRDAARHQNSSAITGVARRIAPTAQWNDLIVSASVHTQLRELLARVKLAPQVLDEWDLRSSARRGPGIKALFCGPPGTGKTLAAEVIAGSLGLELFVIDLSSVVDKYIGETEKHLERIFRAASQMNGVLFFDEADALFGKRSSVQEAKDRYANIETSYLLQRFDSFDGFAILATNLRSNLDEAFTRRLDVVVELGMPERRERQRLWDQCLGPRIPRDADVDLPALAKSFELSGGSIRNIALTAAFFAAEGDGCLHMEDLIWAVHREYAKLGRLISEQEFGPWYKLVAE